MAATLFSADPLRWFGQEVESGRNPYVGMGGFIVPGDEPAHQLIPGKRGGYYGSKKKEDGTGKGRREAKDGQAKNSTAANGTETHSVLHLREGSGRYTVGKMVRELYAFYPGTRRVYSSRALTGFIVPVGPFKDLQYRARVALEIPKRDDGLGLRAWGLWEYPSGRCALIPSLHRCPDLSMCVHSTAEWIFGKSPILDYMSFCVFWVAKAMYDARFKHYPGRQHYPTMMRMERDRPLERCGCGSEKPYRDCHRPADLKLEQDVNEMYRLTVIENSARHDYRAYLRKVGRSVKAPEWVRR